METFHRRFTAVSPPHRVARKKIPRWGFTKKKRHTRKRKKTRRSPPSRERVSDTRGRESRLAHAGLSTRLSWTKKRPRGETRCGRRGRFGAAGASGRTRELGHVLASHLLEPPSLGSGCGEAGLRVRDGRKARPLGLGWSRSETNGVRLDRRARARAASGYSAREAMCAREVETCDLLGQVVFALIVPRARPRAARAAVSVTRLFASSRET